MKRTAFLAATSAIASTAAAALPARAADMPVVKPPRLRPGDKVGLVSPAGPMAKAEDLKIAIDQLRAVGLEAVVGKHVMDKTAYLAGSDEARASDLNAFARDPQIRGIFATRGGYGTMRILDAIDYDAFKRDPKVVLGFSDITALINTITARTGLVTFHGPVAAYSTYTPIVVAEMQALLMNAQPLVTLHNATTTTIVPGTARGKLVGGNLTLIDGLFGTPYAIPVEGNILLVEDVHENPYQIDQLLTTLLLGGVLQSAAGIAAGVILERDRKESDGPSPDLMFALRDRLGAANRPAVQGMQFGHILNQWVLPIGLDATLDATAGTLSIDEPAVN
ncbi:MAG TPA: LD-carboxypeptidase [Candidatus Rubrimentiphilum sp.]|nr:LD-carboxypeptidase [Candidatus Rubrimentiphilum sp.]